jgi:hypothetical protein
MRRNRPQPERGSVTRSNLRTPMALSLSLLAAIALSGCVAPSSSEVDSMEAGQRAIHYLSREVAAWNPEHNCFSCHNNGDGAAALFLAGLSQATPATPDSLTNTVAWLKRPEVWHENKGDPAYSDFKLARIQFGGALLNATYLDPSLFHPALPEAARQIAADQDADGSWKIETDSSPGSPVTYGNAIATARAIKILSLTDKTKDARPIASARRWLRDFPIHNTTSAAGVLLGLGASEAILQNSEHAQSRDAATQFLLRAQSKATGGWGPYPNASPEPFDTAVALIALTTPHSAFPVEKRRAIAAGRAYLLSSQFEEGGWPETTRPAGEQSYAQHISTTAWCLMALTLSADEISVQLIGQP